MKTVCMSINTPSLLLKDLRKSLNNKDETSMNIETIFGFHFFIYFFHMCVSNLEEINTERSITFVQM